MKKYARLLGVLAASVALMTGFASAQEPQYRFVMVSHIGSNDPNMAWLTSSMKEFEERYPNVKAEYVSTNNYSVQEHVRLLEQTIATRPDGIAIPIVSSEAFEGPLRRAMDEGIPVIAFNIADGRPQAERIPYLTYVGGDEYLTGKRTGEYAIEQAKAGKIPMPKRAFCGNIDAAHQGLKARCQGFTDALAEVGAETVDLFIGAEPTTARNTMQSFLQANPDTNYIFAIGGWVSPWAYGVAQEMGLDPDVDDKGVTIVSVDEAPVAIEGIRQGKILSTVSQGFWLQGYAPMEWLYWYKRYGYAPQSDILTGPILINADNADQWAQNVRAVFGDKTYDELNTW